MSDQLQSFLSKLDAVKAIGAGWWRARCPAHNDTDPSLDIKRGDKQPVVIICRSRGCSGDDIASAVGMSIRDLCAPVLAGNSLVPATTATAPRVRADIKPSRRADLPKWEPLDRPVPTTWTFIESYHYEGADGVVVAVKDRYTKSDGKEFRVRYPTATGWVDSGGPTLPLYGLHRLVEGDPSHVVVVEGEKDVETMWRLGFDAISTPSGAAQKWRPSDSQYLAGRVVYVIPDDDEPGIAKAENTADALRGVARSVHVIRLPNPTRRPKFDVSDFVADGGTADQLRELFEAAELPPEVVRFDAVAAEVRKLYREGFEPGLTCGIKKLDALWRLRIPEICVITGAPGAGKSTFANAVLARTSHQHSWRWLVASPEQFPPSRFTWKMLQACYGMPFLDGHTARMTESQVDAGLQHIKESFDIIDTSYAGCDLDRIFEVGAILNRRKKLHGIVIDPFNVVAALSRPKNMSEHDFVNYFFAKLRAFTQSQKMLALVVAHPKKLEKKDDGDYPVVRPWDISGSAHFYNHADAILSVWRPLAEDRASEVEIHTQKIRFQPEAGQEGMARLYYDRVTGRYHDDPFMRSVAQQTRFGRQS